MNIQVYPHRIILNKTNEVNSGEYNVNECTFEFSQEYEGLTKVAVFSLCDGTTKNVTILNNQCIIPVECLQETGQVQIGVYGYATQDNELVLRYSPTPQNFVVRLGSYKEGTQPVAPTPTDWEILVEQVSDIAEDVSSIHEDITGINGEISGINIDIRDLQDTKANISDLAEVAFTGEFSDLKNIPSYATTQQLNQEIQDRQDADVNLQSQIDAISVSSDVVDVVGTYQELVDYDTQHLKDNDIVKVLQDSTHSNALSYYRWDKETSTWSYVGSEGPFYTKSETDALLNDKQDVIDIDNMLSSDLVDDTNSTNKFVTQADITNWNNKEDKSNKVTEINSSSTDTQYPSAKCVYDSQEEQNEHIAELEMLYNAFPTVSDEDTTIQLDNTAKVKFREIDLKGNTSQVVIPEEQGTSVSNTSIYVSDVNTDKENTIEMSGNTYQETTSGKNLLNTLTEYSAGYSTTINGITFTINEDGTITANGTVEGTDNARFTFINNTSILGTNKKITSQLINGKIDGQCSFFTYDNAYENARSSQVATDGSVNNTALGTNVEYTRFRLTVYAGATVNNAKIGLMVIDTSETDYTYERFTNGASPNPDYPQNIDVVTGTQNVEVCGKNLLDTTKMVQFTPSSANWCSVDGIDRFYNETQIIKSNVYYDLKANTTYTFSVYSTLNKNTSIGSPIQLVDTSGRVIISISQNETYTTFTTTEDIRVYPRMSVQSANTLAQCIVQLEQGSTVTPYEAYQGTTYPINLGNIELCKIDTYKDRIYKQNDKWYLEKQIGKVVLDGTQDLSATGTNTTGYYRFNIDIGGNIYTTDTTTVKAPFYCNKLLGVTRGNTYARVDGVAPGTTNFSYKSFNMYIEAISQMTAVQAKSWLSQNNVIVYYPYATPTTTEITDTTLVNQLNALYNATIYPITNINTNTSNLLPYIDLHYNFVTPSPSPSRPSVVNVVKGDNTITISNSDNTESQNYPINLGDMELCKIGTYQDYIYESNGNWFKKSNIGKVTLNGSEDWNFYSTADGNLFRYSFANMKSADKLGICLCNKFEVVAKANRKNYTLSGDGPLLDFIDNDFENANAWKYWLNNNNILLYYVLATPTDTQITDTTLITQLNNIKKAYSYETQTNISQTNTDKPFIIYAEAIRSLKDVFE